MSTVVPFAFDAFDGDKPTMVFYDAICRGQAQAGSTAHRLGREERFEDAAAGGGIHADTRVGDRDFNVAAGAKPICRNGRRIEVDVGCLNSEDAAAGHGLPGVDVYVQQHLFDLAAVGLDGPEIGLQFFPDDNPFLHATEHAVFIPYHRTQIKRFDFVLAPAREPEQLPRQIRGASDVLFDSLEIFDMRVIGVDVDQHDRGAALDAHQQVVEIMRNAARQGADGFHFLGLKQLLLKVLGLGDVARDHDDAEDIPVFTSKRRIRRPP